LSTTDLQAASTFALDDDFAVQRAQFDLANVSAGAVNLLGYLGRALQTTASFVLQDAAASVDANRRRFGVEVRLKHTPGCPTSAVAGCRLRRTEAAVSGESS
jgi:hypothetical protein